MNGAKAQSQMRCDRVNNMYEYEIDYRIGAPGT